MPRCCFIECGLAVATIVNGKKISVHRLPTKESRRKQWIDALGVENLLTDNKVIYICSRHFEESCFNRTLSVLQLREDAVPTLHLPHTKSNEAVEPPKMGEKSNSHHPLAHCTGRISSTNGKMPKSEEKHNDARIKPKPPCVVGASKSTPYKQYIRALSIIKKLRVKNQRKTLIIHRYHMKVKHQRIKIANLTKILQILKGHSSGEYDL